MYSYQNHCIVFYDNDNNGSSDLGRTTRLRDSQQKKTTCRIVNFAIPADHRVKLKESEKRDKYLDLERELKKKMKHESDSDTSCGWCTRINP